MRTGVNLIFTAAGDFKTSARYYWKIAKLLPFLPWQLNDITSVEVIKITQCNYFLAPPTRSLSLVIIAEMMRMG
jgi:hypothetical protein